MAGSEQEGRQYSAAGRYVGAQGTLCTWAYKWWAVVVMACGRWRYGERGGNVAARGERGR